LALDRERTERDIERLVTRLKFAGLATVIEDIDLALSAASIARSCKGSPPAIGSIARGPELDIAFNRHQGSIWHAPTDADEVVPVQPRPAWGSARPD
jgi:hypothetical protein